MAQDHATQGHDAKHPSGGLKPKHRSGELRGEMRGIASYLWQQRADFCGGAFGVGLRRSIWTPQVWRIFDVASGVAHA
jgi:hypothetical protein